MSDTLPAPAAKAVKAIAGSLARHVLTMAGMALVSHGIVDQGQVDVVVNPLAEQAMGVAVLIASTGWSTLRSYISHTRYADAWAVITGEKEVKAITAG